MNAKTGAKWIEADAWAQKTKGIPPILAQEAAKRARVALRKARPFKAPTRVPRGQKVKVKLTPLPKLKKELDRVFSIFIRRRDCFLPGDWGNCATCRVPIHVIQSAQASHYQVRQDMATRWDETNVHAACGNCNGFRGGEPEKMAVYIDDKYGDGTAADLRENARKPFKLNRSWLVEKIAHYKKEIGE